MPTQPHIEIPLGKGAPLVAVISGLILMAFFGVLLLAFWLSWSEAIGADKNKEFIGMVIMAVITALCGLSVLVSIKKILFKRIGLTIDELGITDHLQKMGLIEWKDIESIEIPDFKGLIGWLLGVIPLGRMGKFYPLYLYLFKRKSLTIKVKNPQKYISREASAWRRMNHKAIHSALSSPIIISSLFLKCSFSQLELWVREGWERSKQAPTRENF